MPTPTQLHRLEASTYWLDTIGLNQVSQLELKNLMARYPLSIPVIRTVVEEVAHRLNMKDTWDPSDVMSILVECVRQQSSYRLLTLAERIPADMTWYDVVLPQETLEMLMEIITFARYRSQVMDSWGFRKKLAYGRALSALFHGPPGTGKTMIAAVIANDLDRELLRVDLSQVTSKWIGETEKNLAMVFEEAKRQEAVLLFDEADSLFTKRTAVKSSVDRYSNMNVNFLLQAMEEYEGVVLLTTNRIASIDEAFNRRIRFKVEFPFPDQELRTQLWRVIAAGGLPLSADINFEKLGATFEMSGGNIKEAVLRAAFTAAERDEDITHEILFDAARRVYKEMGRLVGASPDTASPHRRA